MGDHAGARSDALLTRLAPILCVADLGAERRFYEPLGLRVTYEGPEYPNFIFRQRDRGVRPRTPRELPTRAGRSRVDRQLVIADIDEAARCARERSSRWGRVPTSRGRDGGIGRWSSCRRTATASCSKDRRSRGSGVRSSAVIATLHRMWFRDRMDRCDGFLRGRLEPGERLVAIGRCEDITGRLDIEQGGAGATFVMVTDRSLRWVPHVDLRFQARLDLAGVTSATERFAAHRYAIALEHHPIQRPWWVPAHRLLRFEWGNAVEVLSFGRTELAFSRRETEAAIALGEQLKMRGVLPAEASHR